MDFSDLDVKVNLWNFHEIYFRNTFHIQKCLETGKQQNPLKKSLFQGIWSFLLLGILLFILFPDTFGKGWKVKGSRGFVISPVARA